MPAPSRRSIRWRAPSRRSRGRACRRGAGAGGRLSHHHGRRRRAASPAPRSSGGGLRSGSTRPADRRRHAARRLDHRGAEIPPLFHTQALQLFRDVDVLLAPATPCRAPSSAKRHSSSAVRRAAPAEHRRVHPADLVHRSAGRRRSGLERGENLPIGVQVIAPPWREDLALRVARALERDGVVSAPVAPAGGLMDINLPDVIAEVAAAFARYEARR